jgi:hypothetical protein
MNVEGNFGSIPSHRGPDGPSGPTFDDVEAALVKLQPRRSTVNRDRLLFLAGKAAGAAEHSAVTSRGFSKIPGMWPLATFASVAAMLVFAVLFGIERGRERTVRTIVKRDSRPAVAFPKSSVVKRPATGVREKPQAALADELRTADSMTAESRLMRSRHPVLMTDPDLLPNSAPTGGRDVADALSVGDTQRVLSDGLSATRPKTPPTSGFPSILNSFRFGRGGL